MPTLHLENHTPYNVDDLARFCARGLSALGCRGEKWVRIIPSKEPWTAMDKRSRGIAYVGRCGPRQGAGKAGSAGGWPNSVACEAKSIVLIIPPPERFTLRRFARLLEHEIKHTKGMEHRDMNKRVFWSLGGVPSWARGTAIRHASGKVLR